MRTIHLLPIALLFGITACNNADRNPPATDSIGSNAMAAKDTMSMDHAVDSAKMITPLPAVPAGAKVFFKSPKNGETVKSPFKVEMGLEGLKLETAGAIVSGSGHHHLLVDAGDSVPAGEVVKKDSTHIHFGKAQSSTTLSLSPGKHVLTLQFADGIHRSYGSKLAATITVNVK